MKKILLGMGSVIRKDDGVGPFLISVAEEKLAGWILINGETVPENYTSYIKKEAPDLLVIVDSADMGLEPGSIRRLKSSSIDSLFLTTHTMSVNFMINYLSSYVREIYMIGIQPKDTSIGEGISEEVRRAAFKVINALSSGKEGILAIPSL